MLREKIRKQRSIRTFPESAVLELKAAEDSKQYAMSFSMEERKGTFVLSEGALSSKDLINETTLVLFFFFFSNWKAADWVSGYHFMYPFVFWRILL